MGLSLNDFLKAIGSGAATVLTGGANVATTLGGMAGAGIMNVVGGGSNVPAVPDSPWVPDFIEKQLYGTAPPSQGGAACHTVPVVTPAQPTTRMVAPPGYVIVECPKGSGQKVAMLRPVARAMGYWRPRRKPPIKVTDWRALMKADSTVKKLKNVQKRAGMVQRARGKKA